MPQPIQRCRICGNGDLVSVLHLGNQTLTGVFPKSREEQITAGPLELVKCHGEGQCGLLQLRHSYDSSEMYGANYGYRSSLNASMVEHLKAKVNKLMALAPLGDEDLVLDIGSNDGTTLSFYPENGPLRVGMDPTAAKFRHYYKPGIQVVADFFNASTFKAHFGERKAKIVTSIAMFYDLEAPLDFVAQVESILAEDGIWHFEQSYMPLMLSQNAYDTICHEHLEYYGLKQIKWMTDRCGLKILQVEINDINGGSFAVTVAKKNSPYTPDAATVQSILEAEEKAGLDTLAPYEAFKARVFKHRDELLEFLGKLKEQGGKVLGYGASTKGNVILQFCGLGQETIPFIAEVNPEKFGAFTPGTLIPIISEKEAHAMNPDYFLAMPWHFRDNLIKREEPFLAGGGKMVFPLPRIEIVP